MRSATLEQFCYLLLLPLVLLCGRLPAAELPPATRPVTLAIPCQFETALPFSEGLAGVLLDGKAGFIDVTGTQVIPCRYQGVSSFSEGLAAIRLGGKWGYIDVTGNERIPCRYDMAGKFGDGVAIVELGGKKGFIDRKGYTVVPIAKDDAQPFSMGMAAVCRNGKWGYIDLLGRLLIPCQYDEAGPYQQELARVRLHTPQGMAAGFIDRDGREVIPLLYHDAGTFVENLAPVRLAEKPLWGCIDVRGREIVLAEQGYLNPFRFAEGLAAVQAKRVLRDDGQATPVWGFIDRNGREVIAPQYEDARNFSQGLAAVKLNGQWGYLDAAGRMVIPPQFDAAASFSEDLAAVKLGDKWGYILHPSISNTDALNGIKGITIASKDAVVIVENAGKHYHLFTDCPRIANGGTLMRLGIAERQHFVLCPDCEQHLGGSQN